MLQPWMARTRTRRQVWSRPGAQAFATPRDTVVVLSNQRQSIAAVLPIGGHLRPLLVAQSVREPLILREATRTHGGCRLQCWSQRTITPTASTRSKQRCDIILNKLLLAMESGSAAPGPSRNLRSFPFLALLLFWLAVTYVME
jgi:hypothetical protein